MLQAETKIILDMILVQNVCVIGILLKRNNCSSCCFLNHIICFCKSRVMLRFVRQGKIQFVPLFIFIEEIAMKVSTTKNLIVRTMMKEITEAFCIYLLLSSTRTNTHTHTHTHTHLSFCIYVTHSHWRVCVCVCVLCMCGCVCVGVGVCVCTYTY